jgi:hypothetical protein
VVASDAAEMCVTIACNFCIWLTYFLDIFFSLCYQMYLFINFMGRNFEKLVLNTEEAVYKTKSHKNSIVLDGRLAQATLALASVLSSLLHAPDQVIHSCVSFKVALSAC